MSVAWHRLPEKLTGHTDAAVSREDEQITTPNTSITTQYGKWSHDDDAGLLSARATLAGMPASTLDPVNAALCTSLAKKSGGGGGGGLDAQLAGATRKALLADVDFESAGSYQSAVLDKLKSKYIVLKGSEPSPQQAR